MKDREHKHEALTTGEAAKYCGVSFRTIIRWIDKGRLEAYKLPGRGDNRIPIGAFVNFLKANKMPIPDELLDQDTGQKIAQFTEQVGEDKVKILIIDDDILLAETIRHLLMCDKYDIDLAHNGIEAGIKLEAFKPHLITLDLHMPQMSGLEVLAMLKREEKYRPIKIIVITASDQATINHALELGADYVLDKPFDNKHLIAITTSLAENM